MGKSGAAKKTLLLRDESGIMGTFWAEGFWAGEART